MKMTDRKEIGWGILRGFWLIIGSVFATMIVVNLLWNITFGVKNSIESIKENRREKAERIADEKANAKFNEIMRRQNEAIKNR